jgi:hypothetical protein
MTIEVPQGKRTIAIVLADSIRELSAYRWTLFHQAWAREVGADGTFYGTESHLARLNLFIGAGDLAAIRGEYNNLVLNLSTMTKAPENMQAAVLAPLVVSIDGKPRPDTTASGLDATVKALLATGITQGQLVEAVEESKKNFKKS